MQNKWLFRLNNNFRRLQFQAKYISMPLKDFQVISKLGEGAYSSVYKVVRKQDENLYALKRVKILSLSNKQQQNALNEIRILASIRHPNIVCYKQAFVDEPTKSLCMIMEFANYGDLAYRIAEKQKKNQKFCESDIWEIFIQIVKGLNQLHKLNIFHRDIKSANVFLHKNQDNKINGKLGDMNVSKISQRGLCMTQTGTPYYASPQVWKDSPYDSKSDIWSLGCVLYELITLKPPFRADDMEGLYKKVVRGIYPRIPSEYSNELSTMIRNLLQLNPDSRPSCQKILKMAIVQKKIKDSQQLLQNAELMRTIRPGETFADLKQSLPKANYEPVNIKREKGLKSVLDTFQSKQRLAQTIGQVQSLPFLQKQKKVRPSQNSDRLPVKDKQVIQNLTRDRKKSQIAVDKTKRMGLQICSMNKHSYHNVAQLKDIKQELKLPKVANRYNNNRVKQKMRKQHSIRNYKLNN